MTEEPASVGGRARRHGASSGRQSHPGQDSERPPGQRFPPCPAVGFSPLPVIRWGSAQPRAPELLRRVLSVSHVCLPSGTFPRAGSLRLRPHQSGWPALRPPHPPDVLGTSPSLQPPPPPFSRLPLLGARWFRVQS